MLDVHNNGKGQWGIRSGSEEKNQPNFLTDFFFFSFTVWETSPDPNIFYPWIKLHLTCDVRLLIHQCLSLRGWLFILCSSAQFVLDASMSCSNPVRIGASVCRPASPLLCYSLLSPCTFDVRTSAKACDNLLWGFLGPNQAKVWNKQYGNQAKGRNWDVECEICIFHFCLVE